MVMSLVITTSRQFNAAGCAAHAPRAWVVASTHDQHRRAFGRAIGGFPLVAVWRGSGPMRSPARPRR
jgi:hypothetical protein